MGVQQHLFFTVTKPPKNYSEIHSFRKLSGFGGFSTKFGGLECFSLFEKVYFFRFQNGSSEEENLHLWRDDFSLVDGDDHETAVVWCALVLVLVLVVDDDDDDDLHLFNQTR